MGISNPLYLTSSSAIVTGGTGPDTDAFRQSVHDRSAYIKNAIVVQLKRALRPYCDRTGLLCALLAAWISYVSKEYIHINERDQIEADTIVIRSIFSYILIWLVSPLFLIPPTRPSTPAISENTRTTTDVLEPGANQENTVCDSIKVTFGKALDLYHLIEDATFQPLEGWLTIKTERCARTVFIFGPLLALIWTGSGILWELTEAEPEDLYCVEEHGASIMLLSLGSLLSISIGISLSLVQIRDRTDQAWNSCTAKSAFHLTSSAIWSNPILLIASMLITVPNFGLFVGMATTMLVLVLYLVYLHRDASRLLCFFELQEERQLYGDAANARKNSGDHEASIAQSGTIEDEHQEESADERQASERSQVKQRTQLQLDFFQRIDVPPESTAADNVWEFVLFAENKLAIAVRERDEVEVAWRKDKTRLRVVEWLLQLSSSKWTLEKKENDELKHKLDKAKEAHSETKRHRDSLLGDLEYAEALIASHKETIANQENEIENLNNTVKTLNKTIDSGMRNLVLNIQREFEDRQYLSKCNEQLRMELEKVAAERVEETGSLQRKIKKLTNEMRDLHMMPQTALESFVGRVGKQTAGQHTLRNHGAGIAALNAQLNDMSSLIEKIKEQCAAEVRSHTYHISQLVDLLAERANETDNAEKRYEGLQEELSRAWSAANYYALHLEGAEGKVRKLELQVTQLETEKAWCDVEHGDSKPAEYVCLGANECQREDCFCKRPVEGDGEPAEYICLGANECYREDCFCRRIVGDTQLSTQTTEPWDVENDEQDCVCTAETECRRENCLYSGSDDEVSTSEESDGYESDTTKVNGDICPRTLECGAFGCDNDDCFCRRLVERDEDGGDVREDYGEASSSENEEEVDLETESVRSDDPELKLRYCWCGCVADSEVLWPASYFEADDGAEEGIDKGEEDQDGDEQHEVSLKGRKHDQGCGRVPTPDGSVAGSDSSQPSARWSVVGPDVEDGSLKPSDGESELEPSDPISTNTKYRSGAFASEDEDAPLESDCEVSVEEEFVHVSDMSDEEGELEYLGYRRLAATS